MTNPNTGVDDDDVFMERGTRWRELLPQGRYAWPLYDWDERVDDGPPLIGYVVYWRRKNGLSTFAIKTDTDVSHETLTNAWHTDENGDREYHLACIVETPEKYAGIHGMHTGHCGFCGRALRDPKSKEIGIGPECLKKLP